MRNTSCIKCYRVARGWWINQGVDWCEWQMWCWINGAKRSRSSVLLWDVTAAGVQFINGKHGRIESCKRSLVFVLDLHQAWSWNVPNKVGQQARVSFILTDVMKQSVDKLNVRPAGTNCSACGLDVGHIVKRYNSEIAWNLQERAAVTLVLQRQREVRVLNEALVELHRTFQRLHAVFLDSAAHEMLEKKSCDLWARCEVAPSSPPAPAQRNHTV